MELREHELAKPVEKALIKQGYTVYSEICPYAHGRLVDIVGLKGDEIIAVELKMSLNKKLFEQGIWNKSSFHKSYICVKSHPQLPTIEKCKKHGIGVMVVRNNTMIVLHKAETFNTLMGYEETIKQIKKSPPGILDAGKPTAKGEGSGKYILNLIKEYILEHPKADWDELYNEIDNHYSSANSMRSALYTWNNCFTLKKWRKENENTE